MATGNEIVGDFLTNLLLGEGVVTSGEPRYEPVKGQKYDAGDIARLYSLSWIGTSPNHVTPVELLDLLNFLNDFTEALEARMAEVLEAEGVASCDALEGLGGGVLGSIAGGLVGGQPGVARLRPELVSICRDLGRWRARLNEYSMFLASIPDADQFDREKPLWHITAPLFLGWFGGPETGQEIPLVAGGFPPGFDATVQRPPDIATPYSLANQLGIAVAWEEERKKLFIRDITPPGVGWLARNWPWVAGGAGVLVVGGLFYAAFRTPEPATVSIRQLPAR